MVYKKKDDWCNEWQRMTTSDTTNDNEEQWMIKRVITNDSECQPMRTSNKKWQWVAANENER